jgi:glycosyltransferase involved in cell wall biosynthesis
VSVACPAHGPLVDALESAGIERLPLPAADASLRIHPVHTAVGAGRIAVAGVALARAARRFRADVIHANTLRTGLVGAVALPLGAPPVVVRAHEHLPPTRLGRAARTVIVRTASAVVAVSDFTASNFDEGLARPVATRVYNSIDHTRFDPGRVGSPGLRGELRIAEDVPLLGEVAQITPWKGQDHSIRVLAALRRSGFDARLVIVGAIEFQSKSYDNQGFLHQLQRLVDELGVRDAVHFLGQRTDVPEILRALDLSLLPSAAEPFGLVTVESMAMGTPPLVSDFGAGPELVDDGVSGRVLPHGRLQDWVAAARELLDDRQQLARLAERGPAAAARFSDDVHGSEMLAVYESALARPVLGGRRVKRGPAVPAMGDRGKRRPRC